MLLVSLAATAALSITAPSHAQSRDALTRENEQLRREIADLRSRCGRLDAPGPGGSSAELRIGELAARVSSIRLGPANLSGVRQGATVTVQLRNVGAAPVALNYKQGSYALADNRGYRYEFFGFERENVKGIPMTKPREASTSNVLAPGETQTVMFLTQRQFEPGQTPGTAFDVSMTFAAYADMGQGRVKLLREYPMTFVGVPASTGPEGAVLQPTNSTKSRTGDAVDRALRNLLGN